MDHSFNINVAKKLGIASAVILNNLYWWIDKNRATAVIQEDVPKETKEKQIANLKKYFPKVAEFILAFYGGGV